MHSTLLLAALTIFSATLTPSSNGVVAQPSQFEERDLTGFNHALRRRHHAKSKRHGHHHHHHDWNNNNGWNSGWKSGNNNGGDNSSSSSSQTTATSTSATSTSSSTATATSTSKAGLAWPNGNANPIGSWENGKIDWYYTWSAYPVDGSSLNFMPMLWGSDKVSEWEQQKDKFDSLKVTAILGMNEPNESSQSNLDASSAASLWNQYIAPYKGKYTLISPACTSSTGYNGGIEWLQRFQQSGADFDAVATHIYETDPEKVIEYLQNIYNTFQKPIYLTEFACQNYSGGSQCSQDEVWQFLIKTTQWMDQQDFIHGYSYFGAMMSMQGVNEFNQLLSSDGSSPTDLGNYYLQSA